MRHIRSFDPEPGPLRAGEADAAGFFDGGTKDQYEAAIAAVHPADGSLPEGQLYHVAGRSSPSTTHNRELGALPRLPGCCGALPSDDERR
jgi:hypothetical protein